MMTLLEQFLSEAQELLQNIDDNLVRLERSPSDHALVDELFRIVHTLKGNSGLFDSPEMTAVLHASEDLMEAVRSRTLVYSRVLADRLLEAMDLVRMLCAELAVEGKVARGHAPAAEKMATALRALIPPSEAPVVARGEPARRAAPPVIILGSLPLAPRLDAYRRAAAGTTLHLIDYVPAQQCFYSGDDCFLRARRTPGVVWAAISTGQPWPSLALLDAYQCVLRFTILAAAERDALETHYRHLQGDVALTVVERSALIDDVTAHTSEPAFVEFARSVFAVADEKDFRAVREVAGKFLAAPAATAPVTAAASWLLLLLDLDELEEFGRLCSRLGEAPPRKPPLVSVASLPNADAQVTRAVVDSVVHDQRHILSLTDDVPWLTGRVESVARTLDGCLRATGGEEQAPELYGALETAVAYCSAEPLRKWLDHALADDVFAPEDPECTPVPTSAGISESEIVASRPEEPSGVTSLKVDPAKVDLLMNLIGEMVVAKNALPYLAEQAEQRYGNRELSLEIKAAYEGINRIAEEMHDAIMQVRMMPCSVIFRRFSRVVRDTANRLGKRVNLVLEGEETEADRNIIESLVDPLMHLVRNSLDHGFESVEERIGAGKRANGTLVIRAKQESDRAVIEIVDDGRGIDPETIRRRSVEKKLIDASMVDRMTDADALDLLFLPGFSTADVVSNLSGRGVGLDAVRTAIDRMHGSVTIESSVGIGTTVRLSLPRTMASTSVIIVEADGQTFGVPMESVVETVRIPRSAVLNIKKERVTTLRGRVVPLRTINDALGLGSDPRANGDDELAVLVLHVGNDDAGLVVDDFRRTADIILKPMSGVLAGLPAYAGSTLMGDGSVLMVLNPKELF